jgi:hypothetical protein
MAKRQICGFTQSVQTVIPQNTIHPPPSIVFPTIHVHLTVQFDRIKSGESKQRNYFWSPRGMVEWVLLFREIPGS